MTLDEAVEISNATRYGLISSVFTANLERGMEAASRLHAGQVVINGTGLYRPDAMAFGGYKQGGNTRQGLDYSLNEYLQIKTISLPGVMPAPVAVREISGGAYASASV